MIYCIVLCVFLKIEQKKIEKDGVRDVFWFQINSLHAMSDLHGENSTEAVEAKQLLNDVILRLNVAFTKAYDKNILINIITSDASHTRRTRSILQADDKPAEDDVSLQMKNVFINYSYCYLNFCRKPNIIWQATTTRIILLFLI